MPRFVPGTPAALEERRAKVAEFMLARWSYRRIAADLGVGYGTVERDAAAIKAEWRARRAEAIDELIAGELARLDTAEAAIWGDVAGGSFGAIDRLLSIQERRAKLLGLDAPTKVAPTSPDGSEPYSGVSITELDREILVLLDTAGTRALTAGDTSTPLLLGSPRQEATDTA
jgi:hypothetical protein